MCTQSFCGHASFFKALPISKIGRAQRRMNILIVDRQNCGTGYSKICRRVKVTVVQKWPTRRARTAKFTTASYENRWVLKGYRTGVGMEYEDALKEKTSSKMG